MLHLKRILFNTASIYLKLIINIGLGLFTTRIVLNSLGMEDFGLYSLVGGTVAMLAFFQSAMSNASMRFLSYSIGRNDGDLKAVLDTTMVIHLFFAFLLVAFLEIIRIPIFTYFIDIPVEKQNVAKFVYHCFVGTTFVSIVSIPYDAIMMSHEDFVKLSFIDVLGVSFTFLLALSLKLWKEDTLFIYSLGMLAIQVLLRIIKQVNSCLSYEECTIHNIFQNYSREYGQSILTFTGWNVLGSLAAISVTSLRGIILNNFFGLRYNAADGISTQVCGKLGLFSSCISQAVNPLMIKNEGAGERGLLLRTMLFSTKMSVFLYVCTAVPVWIFLPDILTLWLRDVPEGCVLFIRLIIIASFIEKMSYEITNAIRAVGKIKGFQVSESIVILSGVPLSIFLYQQGGSYYSVYAVSLCTSLICYFVRLYYGKRICGLNTTLFMIESFRRLILPTSILVILYYIFDVFISHTIFEIILTIVVLSFASVIIFYLLCADNEEKHTIQGISKKVILKILK